MRRKAEEDAPLNHLVNDKGPSLEQMNHSRYTGYIIALLLPPTFQGRSQVYNIACKQTVRVNVLQRLEQCVKMTILGQEKEVYL